MADSIQDDYKCHYQLAVNFRSDFKAEHIVAQYNRFGRLARYQCYNISWFVYDLAAASPEAALDPEVRYGGSGGAAHEYLHLVVVSEDWSPSSHRENLGFWLSFRGFICSIEYIPLVMNAEDLFE